MCGDGFTQSPEECDASGVYTGICDSNCTTAYCGDGTVNATRGEVCDTSGDSGTCDIDCTIPACGDGRINQPAGEECDDGAAVSGDGCSATCQIEP